MSGFRSNVLFETTFNIAVDTKCVTKTNIETSHGPWYQRRPVKAQTSARDCAVSSEPSLFVHSMYVGSCMFRPTTKRLAPHDSCACAFIELLYAQINLPKVSLSHAQVQLLLDYYEFMELYICHGMVTQFQPCHVRGLPSLTSFLPRFKFTCL